jgi:hypothetical protein
VNGGETERQSGVSEELLGEWHGVVLGGWAFLISDSGVLCPHCGAENPMFLKILRIWKCSKCRKQFSFKAGAVFEDSPIGLDKWLRAVWLIANNRNGISSWESPPATIHALRLRTLVDWELDILNHAIESEWFHIRAAKVEAELYKSTPNPTEWTEEQHKKLGRFLRYKTKHANDVRARLKLLEGFKRKRHIETRDTAAATIEQSKVALKTEKEITKRNKSEKLALLEALSHHGLVRYDDLEAVFDE